MRSKILLIVILQKHHYFLIFIYGHVNHINLEKIYISRNIDVKTHSTSLRPFVSHFFRHNISFDSIHECTEYKKLRPVSRLIIKNL